jgi:hypothetical protein
MIDRLFDVGLGVFCPSCDYAAFCGAAHTEDACAPRWGDAAYGGLHVVHPLHPDRDGYMAAVRGPDFMNVRARRVAVPALPPYLPQVRLRRGLRGTLTERIYGIRGWEVIGKRRKLLTAEAIRAELGLSATQKLVLILFDDDTLLERLWEEADVLLADLVEARFDLVVSPSYSIYQPRPRLEHLYNLKRAFEIFARCQQLLIPAIPRGAWFNEFDVRRLAEWLNANQVVRWLAVDLQTLRQSAEWAEVVRGLRALDDLTGQRLRYLVNGPTTVERIADIYSATDSRRVALTSSTLASPPPVEEQLALPIAASHGARYAFARRCEARRRTVTAAAALAQRETIVAGSATVAA